VSWAKVQSYGRELAEDSLTRAFLISLMLHFIGVAGIELGRHLGWWERSLFTELVRSDVMKEVIKTAEKRAEIQKRLNQQPPETELTFVEIDPSQAAPEPPKNAKYYSSQNTVASNLSRDSEKETPKISGKQERVPKVMDVLRPDPKANSTPPPEKEPSKAEVMRPTPPPQPPVETPKAEPAPALAEQKPASPEKGETLLAKVIPREEVRPQAQPNNPPPEEPKRQRPRSVAEAKAQKGLIQGPRMMQHGGARIGMTEGLDVKATPFGAYDAMFIEAVQSRWFSILEERDFVGNQGGRVVVEFRLHQDGRITDLTVVEASVSELLSWFCQRAVLDPAPYLPFPSDLRRMLHNDYREIRFTFYYNQ
jgi:hypothetical protein